METDGNLSNNLSDHLIKTSISDKRTSFALLVKAVQETPKT